MCKTVEQTTGQVEYMAQERYMALARQRVMAARAAARAALLLFRILCKTLNLPAIQVRIFYNSYACLLSLNIMSSLVCK